MSRSHNEVIVPYARYSSTLDGSPAHGNALAKSIPVADFQPCALPSVLQILGFAANSAKRMKHVAAAQAGWAVYDSMRVQNATLAELNVVADNCVGSDADSSFYSEPPGAITARGSTSTVAVARSAVSLILDVRRHQRAELPGALLLQNRGRPFCTSASPLPRAPHRRWPSHAICKNWRARKWAHSLPRSQLPIARIRQ